MMRLVSDFKVVTNLLRRVALRQKVSADVLVFDYYDVKDGETPEIIAHKLYGDSELHWVILLINNITDRYHHDERHTLNGCLSWKRNILQTRHQPTYISNTSL